MIVTVAVVKPKCLDLDYRKHCGQVLGEMKLPPATTQLCEHAYLTDPAELWSQPDQWTRFAQAGSFAGHATRASLGSTDTAMN